MRLRRRLLVAAVAAVLLAGTARAQAPVRSHLPANGSLQAAPCGPFGVTLDPGALTDTADALVVRGSATGLRTRGTLTVAAAGDSLFFTPMVPFAPGETVTITLRGSLRHDGSPLGAGRTWSCRIAADPQRRASGLADLTETTVPLTGALAGGFELLDWTWTDLDGDRDRDGVLLAEAAGTTHLATVTGGGGSWQALGPAVVTADNPVALLGCDLDGNRRGDLVLVALAGLQIWRDPGTGLSPSGGAAAWVPFPAGFNGRAASAGDLDADGHTDLVVLGLFGAEYLVFMGDGTGGLTALAVQAAAPAPGDAAKALPWPVLTTIADADGDGRPDLIWTADFQETGRYPVRLAAGQGDGTFAPAGVLHAGATFARGLVFGGALDPLGGPQVLVATPDLGDRNLQAFTWDGGYPGATAGNLDGPGLAAGAGAAAAGHLLSDSQGDELVSELWYADPLTGTLTARPLADGRSAQTRTLPGGAAALVVGDLDFDGDADLVAALPGLGAVTLLATPGGTPAAPPRPETVPCGGVHDFGTVELGCGPATGAITWLNPGLLPARIEAAVLDDPDGVFSFAQPPAAWFGQGCGTTLASVSSNLAYTPVDTVVSTGTLTVRLLWAGAAADGGDSTLVCAINLQGRGGVFGLVSGPAGPGDLVWNGSGHTASGGAFDLGLLPSEGGAVADTVVTVTNSGHFAVDLTPPGAPDAPWSVDPPGTRRLVPGETFSWTVRAGPHPGLLPAGVDTLALTAELAWTVSAAAAGHCLAPAILRQTAAVTLVRPALTDLAVLDLSFLPLPGETLIRQGQPYLARAIVTARREPAHGAVLTLDGGDCVQAYGPDAVRIIDLAEDRRDTVFFTVTPDADGLDCQFSACLEPAGGLDFEFDPVDNCFTAGARLAANSVPGIVFSNLVLDPPDDGLEPCAAGVTLNTIDAGGLAALGVREGGSVAVTVSSSDAEGDPHLLEVGGAPGFVSVSRVSDTELVCTATPPVGTVVTSACQLFGPLVFTATETAAALPETARVAVPLYVKWEGPDLAVELLDVPAAGQLLTDLRFGGRVTNQGQAAMGAFTVSLWLTDDRGLWVAGRDIDVPNLAAGGEFTLPQVLYAPQLPGTYCAHLAITAGRDLDPTNNTADQCLRVTSGPLKVSPNAATPNGDGHNDAVLFHLANQDVSAPRVRIYELAGALVYESARLDGMRRLSWDGRDLSGRLAPPGSYLYVIDDGGRELAKGVCGVIR